MYLLAQYYPVEIKTLRKPELYMDISLKRKREKRKKGLFIPATTAVSINNLNKTGQQIYVDLINNAISRLICVEFKGNTIFTVEPMS